MQFDITLPRPLHGTELQVLDDAGAAVLTLIAPPGAAAQERVSATLQQWHTDLLARRRLSAPGDGRLLAMEYYLANADIEQLRPVLPALAQHWGADLCLQRASDKRSRRLLLVFDMDSTLITCEVIDELAALAGVGDEVAAITARAMRGELDFVSSFRERMKKLGGLPESALASVAAKLPFAAGADRLFTTLHALGHHTAILSGGFDYFARVVQARLSITEVHANRLQIVRGKLSGEVDGPIVDGERKVALLREIATREGFALADTVAVGDGANDLPMLATAGVGVAFHAKPLVLKRAPCAINAFGLDALLYVLGIADSD